MTALLMRNLIKLGIALRRRAIGGTRSSFKVPSIEKQQISCKGGGKEPCLNTTCSIIKGKTLNRKRMRNQKHLRINS